MWGLLILVALWVLVAPIFALVNAARANRRTLEIERQLRFLRSHLDETVDAYRRQSTAPAPVQPASAAPAAVAPQPATATPAPALSALTIEAPIVAAEPQPPEPQPALPEAEPQPAEPEPTPAPAAAPAEPEAFPTPPPVTFPSITPASERPRESLESKIGARWSVIVGGIALALGAIFLVRYSIEQGLLGPATRIALGFLLSAILFSVGEWLRRRDRALELPVFAQADVPAILTGAGGIALFATIYAAYALYGFIGPAAAFVLLTAAGLVTLVLSVIHGPALAALGALGSYGAPLLVSSTEPAPFPLVFHTLAVTAAVLGMARIRGWQWLAAAGIVASLLWGFALGLLDPTPDATYAKLLLLAGLAAVYVAALLAGVQSTSLRDRPPEPYSLSALAGLAILSLAYGGDDPLYPQLAAGIVATGIMGAVASRWTSAAGLAPLAGLFSVFLIMVLPGEVPLGFESIRVSDVEWAVLGDAGIGTFAMKALALALVVGVGSFLSAERAATTARLTAGAFAAAGAAAPLLILVVVYLRHVPFETRPAIGIAALVLAALYATATERLISKRPDDDTAPAPALYAAGAVLSLSFAIAVGLQGRFIPVALSLGAAGVVWVSLYRPVRILTWLAVALAAFTCLGIAMGSAFTPEEIGTTPILNGLILRLGLPAAALLFAGESLRRHRDGIEAGILQTLGLVVAALFVAFQIRHIAGGGDIRFGNYGLGEQSAYTLAALAFSLGLQRIAARTKGSIYREASLVAGVVGALTIALAHFITVNPLFTGDSVGSGHVFNLLLPGYLLPAIAASMVAVAARPVRPLPYVFMMEALSALLAFVYVMLMIRHAFQGEYLDGSETLGLGEQSAYTIATLAFALGLQWIGERTQSPVYREGSLVAGVAAVLAIAIGHFVVRNPFFTGNSVGPGAFINLLLPGYLLPAIAIAAVAAAARPVKPRPYVLLMAAFALLLAFAYVTLMVRHAFQGEYLDGWAMRDAENWTYSAVWLVFGILLLTAGIALRSTMVRAASGIVIAVVVSKVFLFDMAALTGVLRAASFLGLGVVLIVIGRLYQRLLTRGQTGEATPTPG